MTSRNSQTKKSDALGSREYSLFAEDSHASHGAVQGNEEGLMTPEGLSYGTFADSFEKFDHDASSSKTSKVCCRMRGGHSFRIIVRALTELGYGVEWQILNSKDFGVPQNRQRVYIVGHIGGACRRKVFPLASAGGENPCKLREITSGVKDAYRIYEQDGLARTLKSEGGGLGAKTGLYAVQELLIIRKEKGKGSCGALEVKRIGDEEAATVAARYYKGLSADGCNGVICAKKAEDGRGNFQTRVRIRRLTPRECWRLQGFPDELFDKAREAGVSDTQLYRQAGNAVTVPVVQAIGERLAEIYRGNTDVRG